MKKTCFLLAVILLIGILGVAQSKSGIISGPMLGQIELRSAKIWVEAGADTKTLAIRYWKKGDPKNYTTKMMDVDGSKIFVAVQTEIGGLDPNTSYDYQIVHNGMVTKYGGSFTTKELWQYRKPAPDFSFITGSCNYVNEPVFDRPGKPYGGDSSIFETMAKENAAFMLWLGDNWYTRDVDYSSEWGLWYRASHDRAAPVLQPLLKAMPHYAIWDDHDFGPNNMGSSYGLKNTSREVFKHYWANPFYGEEGKGIYSKFSYSDVDFFLIDDRTWRSEDNMPASIYGQPNPEKRMLGTQQMAWLKQSLLYSNATFKIVVIGTQVLNPVSPFDKMIDFPIEYNELTGFLKEQKIKGVVFMSGDRHHSEIIKINRPGQYPLYDITVSPLTSGTHSFGASEKDNPFRVLGIDKLQNYGRVSFSGPREKRIMKVEFLGTKGEKIGEWSVEEKAIQ